MCVRLTRLIGFRQLDPLDLGECLLPCMLLMYVIRTHVFAIVGFRQLDPLGLGECSRCYMSVTPELPLLSPGNSTHWVSAIGAASLALGLEANSTLTSLSLADQRVWDAGAAVLGR
jgi:hypothetical protein